MNTNFLIQNTPSKPHCVSWGQELMYKAMRNLASLTMLSNFTSLQNILKAVSETFCKLKVSELFHRLAFFFFLGIGCIVRFVPAITRHWGLCLMLKKHKEL